MEDETVKLTFRLEGSVRDDRMVRAREFVAFLQGVMKALTRLERQQTGQTGQVVYRVTDLGIGSAIVQLEAASPERPGEAHSIVSRFVEGATAMARGGFELAGLDAELQEAFGELMAPLRKHVRTISIESDVGRAEFEATRLPPLSQQRTRTTDSVGAVSGFIDAINVHDEPVCYLYPTTGGPKVACRFDRLLLDDARRALKTYTTVHGLVEYPIGSAFPARVVVERFEVHPPPDALPTLRSLFGLSPDLTGGVDSVTYIRRIRDAEL